MDKPFKVLLIEDDPGDSYLTQEMLAENNSHLSVDVVDRISTAIQRIDKGSIDIILMDLGLPDSQGIESFRRVHEKSGNIPIVVLTGWADELTGLQAVNSGAQDFVYKGEINGRVLSRVLKYARERKRLQEELSEKISQLESALTKVKQLEGIIPICMHCKKIRDEREHWFQIEQYITEHSEAYFSHSICPDCMKKYDSDD